MTKSFRCLQTKRTSIKANLRPEIFDSAETVDLQQIVLPVVLGVLVRLEVPEIPFILQWMLGDEHILAAAGVLLTGSRLDVDFLVDFLFAFGVTRGQRLVNNSDRMT